MSESFFRVGLNYDKELQDQFNKLPRATMLQVLDPALNVASRMIMDSALTYVPVKTGRLRSSIHRIHITGIGDYKRNIGYVVQTGVRSELGIDSRNPYYYPSALEFGRRPRGRGTKRVIGAEHWTDEGARVVSRYRRRNRARMAGNATKRLLAGKRVTNKQALALGTVRTGKRPFMKRSLNDHRDEVDMVIKDSVRASMERIARETTKVVAVGK